MHFRRRFWGFWNFLGFLLNFWVGCCWFNVICSCIAFSLHFNNVSYILDVCLIIVKCVLVGLDWVFTHDAFKFCMSHVYAYFMCTYSFIPISGLWCVISLSLSLSLSDKLRYGTQARKSTSAQNPLGSSLLLLILFPIFTFGSVMRRPKRTSLTPIYMESIPLYLGLPLHFELHES